MALAQIERNQFQRETLFTAEHETCRAAKMRDLSGTCTMGSLRKISAFADVLRIVGAVRTRRLKKEFRLQDARLHECDVVEKCLIA